LNNLEELIEIFMNVLEKNIEIQLENHLQKLFKEANQWHLELDIIASEILFIKQILKSYPFQSQRANLFERLQTFIQRLESLEDMRNFTLYTISMHKTQLVELKKNVKYFDYFLKINHEIIEEEYTRFMEDYKNLKWKYLIMPMPF